MKQAGSHDKYVLFLKKDLGSEPETPQKPSNTDGEEIYCINSDMIKKEEPWSKSVHL